MESPQYQTSCRNATRASARFPARVTFISGAAWDSLSPSSGSFLSPHAVLGLILNSEQLALNGLSELLQPRSRSPFSVFVSAHKAERKTDCNRDDGGCLSVCAPQTLRQPLCSCTSYTEVEFLGELLTVKNDSFIGFLCPPGQPPPAQALILCTNCT